ncbi:unnamed protein product [Rotaria socialis]|uniref:Uncharacterized protein n=2 Tax=Rotaria socialis TaxID=392032 RepID=A0A818PHS3_9BILA|nr:unnamed protein product [Rotaria socialis]
MIDVGLNDQFLQQINCNVDVTHKRKKPSGETHNVTNKTKRSTGVSHSDYENLKRENKRLAKEIDMYKNNWMRKSPIVLLRYQISFSPARPPGPTASYFIDVGKFLSEPRSQIILALFGIMHCNALDDKHYPSFFPLFIHYRLHGNPWPANACSSPMNDGSGVVQSLINKQAPASGLDALCTNGSVIELNNVTVVLNETNWEIQIVGAQSSYLDPLSISLFIFDSFHFILFNSFTIIYFKLLKTLLECFIFFQINMFSLRNDINKDYSIIISNKS